MSAASDRWQRILQNYTPQKKAWDRTYPWLAFVLRPLSFPVTWALMPLGITANQVTFLTLILGLGALACFAQGLFLWAAALMVLLNLFDCVDGNLARLQPPPAVPAGKFYDQLVGLVWYAAYFFLGLGLARQGSSSWDPLTLLTAGAGASLLKMMGLHVRGNFWGVLGQAWEKEKIAGPPSESQARTVSWYYRLYYNLTDLQGQDPLLLLAALTGGLDLFLLGSVFLLGGETLFLLVFYVLRAGRMARSANRR